MIKVALRHIEAIKSATKPNELFEVVQEAIRLEFSTIPPYLTAMFSLPPPKNRQIWELIHAVVIDEMLHMSIMCNILNALGGSPKIASANFVHSYPSPLPLSIHDGLIVGLEPFSIALVESTFMGIEQPEHPLVFPEAELLERSYASIGAFYTALKEKLVALGDGAFSSPSAKQFTAPNWFSSDRLFPILNAGDAAKAIDIIVQEGEGTTLLPTDERGFIAHYYRFQQIAKGRLIEKDSAGGFAFNGAKIDFDPSDVLAFNPNQTLSAVDPNSQAGLRAQQFSLSFTKLLTALHKTFNGVPEHFDSAIALMFELKLAGQKLCSTEILENGVPTGKNCGPTFQFLII